MEFKIGDYVQTIKGDRVSGIKKSGQIIGFGKWCDFNTLKIQVNGYEGKRVVSILEKNAILLKRGKKKEKIYSEKEVLRIIDNWKLTLGDKLTKTHRYVEKHDIERLKSKFMTPQGFRKAIDKARLVGTQFD